MSNRLFQLRDGRAVEVIVVCGGAAGCIVRAWRPGDAARSEGLAPKATDGELTAPQVLLRTNVPSDEILRWAKLFSPEDPDRQRCGAAVFDRRVIRKALKPWVRRRPTVLTMSLCRFSNGPALRISANGVEAFVMGLNPLRVSIPKCRIPGRWRKTLRGAQL
jgi:hypothetical protein